VRKKRPNGRLIFVGAVAAVLILTPLVALFAGGGRSTDAARARASAPTADIATADVPHRAKDPNDRPLPKARPTVIDPQAGVTGTEESGAGGGQLLEGPPTEGSACPKQPGLSPGVECDDAIKADRKQQLFWQAQVKRAPEKFAISYGTGRLVWPLPSQYRTLSSLFCERRSWEACHPGIDIPAPIGTPIVAADAGTVIIAGPSGGYGNYTCIQHTKSLSTCYAHQSRQMVRPGDDVRRGQVIGLVGCTGLCFGSHLHFETRNNGQVFDPMTFF
jgi:murein DD-endopeptidase MepM/ murein hydrolase activator NlpD